MSLTQAKEAGATRLFETIEQVESVSLEAVRNFLDAVTGALPDMGGDDGPRQKIIDAAFKMTEQLVGTSTRLAKSILDVTEKTLSETGQKAPKSTRA